MTVLAELEGHAFDLDTLARQFPTGDPHIVVTDEGTFLAATALDDLFDDARRLVDTANEHLARLNGYVTLVDGGYQHVRLGNKFVREGEPTHVPLVASDEARARDSLTVVAVGMAEGRVGALDATVVVDGEPVEPPPPQGPLHLARADKDVADLLALIGNAATLGWDELWKALEIIKVAVGGQKALVDSAWVTDVDLEVFGYSANHPDASGADARHARRPKGKIPSRVMSIEEGRQFIRGLARKWLDSLP